MTNQAKTTRKAATASRNTASESRPKATSESLPKATSESRPKAASESRPNAASKSRQQGPSQLQQSAVRPSRLHSSEPDVEGSEPELRPRSKATSKSRPKAASEFRHRGPSQPQRSEVQPSEFRHRGPSQPQQSQVQPSLAHSSEPEVDCSEPELPLMPALKVREQSFSQSTSTSRANSDGADRRPRRHTSRAARGWITITNAHEKA
jgi:hypothetical protein